MKANNTIMPPAYEICSHGKDALLYFRENAEKTDGGYTYDEYTLKVPMRDNLRDVVASDTSAWLAAARERERAELASRIRKQRNRLLDESDWTQCPDCPISDEMRRRWALYRQQLRDITSQSDFPGNVLYPEIPK